MSTLKLTDDFGLIIDAEPLSDSVFIKYLRSPGAIVGALRNPKPIKDLLISDDPFQSQSIGVAFTNPVKLGNADVELSVKLLTGTVSIARGTALFDAETDAFREPLPIQSNQAYLALALAAELDVAIADKLTDLQFGFTAGTTIVITNYRICAITGPIVPALQRVFTEFTLPGDLEDIGQLSEHDVVTLEGTGSLQFTAQANLLTSSNPLATLNVPFLPINVAEGASVTINGVYTLTGAYQLRIERLDGRKFRLGYQKKRTSEFDVSVQAQVTTDVRAGGFDLIKTILQAVSPDPVPDKDAFQQAGLTEDELSAIAAAIKTGIERNITLSLTGDLDALDSSSTAFGYDIDAALLDESGRKAVHDALGGDLTGVEGADHVGVIRRKSVFDTLRRRKRVLKVNLLGIFNYASVSTLFQKGTFIVDRETGDVTITDQAGAERIQFTADNFAQDTARLRRVLAESLLITVAYRGTGAFTAGRQLETHYWFVALHQQTNLEQITDSLIIAQALQLLGPPARAAKLAALGGITAFGRSTLFIDASYSDALCQSMFVNESAQPRPESEYETLGRGALLLLLPAGDPINNARRVPLTDDATWNTMKSAGQPGFPALFAPRGFNANQIADITADYTLITWWAGAMHGMGEALAQIQSFLAMHPADYENNTFKQLRSKLERAMASVVSNTQPQFGEPWGILALDLASGQQSATSLHLVSPRMTLVCTQRIPQDAKSAT